ncbi:hypothetical protein SAY87_016522 [Trapa incisa]|uniref:Uncharacterized protein n=1 Tax=Trapa incisa TaxID=236973 RepID=A0AAN7L6Y8_9MYRT|nr:hypothetical protein SAY87_016522 [Trapa incisa]
MEGEGSKGFHSLFSLSEVCYDSIISFFGYFQMSGHAYRILPIEELLLFDAKGEFILLNRKKMVMCGHVKYQELLATNFSYPLANSVEMLEIFKMCFISLN